MRTAVATAEDPQPRRSLQGRYAVDSDVSEVSVAGLEGLPEVVWFDLTESSFALRATARDKSLGFKFYNLAGGRVGEGIDLIAITLPRWERPSVSHPFPLDRAIGWLSIPVGHTETALTPHGSEFEVRIARATRTLLVLTVKGKSRRMSIRSAHVRLSAVSLESLPWDAVDVEFEVTNDLGTGGGKLALRRIL